MINASIELAETIARKSPIAVQGSKINLNYARDHSTEDNLNFAVNLDAQRAMTCAKMCLDALSFVENVEQRHVVERRHNEKCDGIVVER